MRVDRGEILSTLVALSGEKARRRGGTVTLSTATPRGGAYSWNDGGFQ